MTAWLNEWTWPKVVFFGAFLLIVTRIVAPEAAAWVLDPVVNLSRAAFAAIQGAM